MAELQKKRKRAEEFAQQKPILDERPAPQNKKSATPSPEDYRRATDALKRSKLTLKDITGSADSERFAESAKGNEAPSDHIETRREGRRQLRERDREIRKELRQKDIPKEELREKRRELAKARIARFASILGASIGGTEFAIGRRKFRRESDEVCGWMTEDPGYLGNTIGRRLEKTPPMPTFAGEGHFARYELLYERPAIAYFPHSNNLIFNNRLMGESRADRMNTIAHEQLHYASWLGGGHEMRWRAEGIGPINAGFVSWFHEGLTELHSQQLTRRHGLTPSDVSYPGETLVCFYVQQIVGEEVLRRAYLSGDFTEVRRILDERLGAGTFDRLLAPGTSNGAEALAFLESRIERAGIDTSGWGRNPLAMMAREGMRGERPSRRRRRRAA